MLQSTTTPRTSLDELTQATAQQILKDMLLIRRFEEKCAELYSGGKIWGFLHLYIGEEAIAVGAMRSISSEDSIVSTYREHGHALARGIPAGPVMAEMFGKSNGCSGGRGGSMHLFDRSRRFYGGNAIVAGGLPLAVGLALADKMQNRSAVTVCFFGDGACGEGEFHESLNLAALWKLPIVFLLENNFYAMGTALERHQSRIDIHAKAAGYGIEATVVDGMDVLAVEAAAATAVESARERRPYFIEAQTYRFRAHSMYDAELYRSKQEVEQWKQRDPILLWRRQLGERGWLSEPDWAVIESEVAADVQAAVEFAESGPLEPIDDLLKHVYAPVTQ